MSGDVSERKRLIAVTGANLRNAHLYISGHHDFFPPECYGASNEEDGLGQELTLRVEGLPEPKRTDIARDGDNGHPRNFFRRRAWIAEFFKRHDLRQGDNSTVYKVARGLRPLRNDGR